MTRRSYPAAFSTQLLLPERESRSDLRPNSIVQYSQHFENRCGFSSFSRSFLKEALDGCLGQQSDQTKRIHGRNGRRLWANRYPRSQGSAPLSENDHPPWSSVPGMLTAKKGRKRNPRVLPDSAFGGCSFQSTGSSPHLQATQSCTPSQTCQLGRCGQYDEYSRPYCWGNRS